MTFDRQSTGEYGVEPIASTVAARDYKSASDLVATYDMRGNGDGETVGTLTGDHAGRPTDYTPVVCSGKAEEEVRLFGGDGQTVGAIPAQPGMKQQSYIATTMQVRRLLPVETEKLQALPPGWTLIPWRGKPAADCPDGPRYKGIGNGQTVSVMRWLAERIKKAIAV